MIETFKSMCPMNCLPTYCGMEVEVENGRVVKIRGDKENPDSRGFLCLRGASVHEVIHHPERLKVPLLRRRIGDPWQEVSWSQALDVVAEKMESAGKDAVGIWTGHGILVNSIGPQLALRFSQIHGCQAWSGAMKCWTLGAFGLALTGALEVNTKEDMAAHSRCIFLWGANFSSQPNSIRPILAAKRRGATLVTLDCRYTEACRFSDRVVLLRPGTDAALALAMMNVLIGDGLYDKAFVRNHAVGFPELARHVEDKTPEWAEGITGVPAPTVRELARLYATHTPSMIVLGGSSMFKQANGWVSSRAISCLPALVGNLGIPGGGFGPRHGGSTHDEILGTLLKGRPTPLPHHVPNQMSRILQALEEGPIRVLLLFGTDMVSSFAESNRVKAALDALDLVVVHDLFLSETAKHAHLVLPGTTWLEEVGYKKTNTHVYLMDQAIEPVGQARSLSWVLKELSRRLSVQDFFPWPSQEQAVDAILDVPATGHITVSDLRARRGREPLRISPVAHPDLRFPTPSGKVEFYSERSLKWGLPPLPEYREPLESPRSRPEVAQRYPLVLRPGRTFGHFNNFYRNGRAISRLARREPEPVVWLHPEDAAARGIQERERVVVFNDRSEFQARAKVTARIFPGTVWVRTGWPGLNALTACAPCLPDAAVEGVGFAAGQAAHEALVEVKTLMT